VKLSRARESASQTIDVRANAPPKVPQLRPRHSTRTNMPFAQLVIGPPGSGKSTYCDGMQQFMGAIERKCSVVNLDPANDHTSYQPALDVRDLVTIDEIMEQETLGPNGGVLFALEELEHNFDWLEEGLKELGGLRQRSTLLEIS
jgi:GTPase SAR1 family protein